ncbi:MAG: undecaprenyl-diphosphatase [Candidatus Parcubacteria bacterium]|nr:MAG: undecaprenyl-diphosphatase [Candidatus Parcubacteria bacterium]
MTLVEAALLGILQGVTEPWPISSSGHLVLAHWLLGEETGSTLAFDAAIHLATGLAIAWYFRSDIVALLRRALRAPQEGFPREILWIMLAALPAALAGVVLADAIEAHARSPHVVALALALGSLAMLGAEKMSRARQAVSPSAARLFIIGVAQALALIPGVSRSGITLAAARAQGFAPEEAARWSFLIGLPVIFGAGLWALAKMLLGAQSASSISWGAVAVASLCAFLAAFAALVLLIPLLKRWGLAPFALYRLVLAGALVVVFFVSH